MAYIILFANLKLFITCQKSRSLSLTTIILKSLITSLVLVPFNAKTAWQLPKSRSLPGANIQILIQLVTLDVPAKHYDNIRLPHYNCLNGSVTGLNKVQASIVNCHLIGIINNQPYQTDSTA